jgi:hypothetical protein
MEKEKKPDHHFPQHGKANTNDKLYFSNNKQLYYQTFFFNYQIFCNRNSRLGTKMRYRFWSGLFQIIYDHLTFK